MGNPIGLNLLIIITSNNIKTGAGSLKYLVHRHRKLPKARSAGKWLMGLLQSGATSSLTTQ